MFSCENVFSLRKRDEQVRVTGAETFRSLDDLRREIVRSAAEGLAPRLLGAVDGPPRTRLNNFE